MSDAPLTFVNVITVRPDTCDQVVALLQEGLDEVFRHRPGFIDATLLVSMDRTRVVNVARWATAEDVAANRDDPAAAAYGPRIAALVPTQSRVVLETDPVDDRQQEGLIARALHRDRRLAIPPRMPQQASPGSVQTSPLGRRRPQAVGDLQQRECGIHAFGVHRGLSPACAPGEPRRHQPVAGAVPARVELARAGMAPFKPSKTA